jgi:hypothetical protein
MHILCTLRNVKSFIGYFFRTSSHNQSHTPTVLYSTQIIIHEGSHWLAVYVLPKAYKSYFFDSYGQAPYIPNIQTFITKNCSVWEYNKLQLQGLNSTVCGKYYCLFALYMDRGFTPSQFVGLFDARIADRQVTELLESEFGSLCTDVCGGQCCTDFYKR